MSWTLEPGPPVARASASDRLHAMDYLRAAAMLLGIFLHAALSFMQMDVPWAVRDSQRSLIFDAFVGTVHGFRMQLFFVIAGFFGCLLYERLGPKRFAWHRTQRILIPFVAGMVLLIPAQAAVWNFVAAETPRPSAYPEVEIKIASWMPAHLWFLYDLVIFYAAVLLAVPVLRRVVPRNASQWMLAQFSSVLQSRWKVVVLTVPSLGALSFSPYWHDVELAGTNLVPHLRALFYYGVYFAFGWLVRRTPGGLAAVQSAGKLHFAWAALAFAAFGITLGLGGETPSPNPSPLKWLCHAAHELYAWCAVFGMTGWFLRRFQTPHPWIRYLADSSYWLYLVHLPLVLYFQWISAPIELPAVVKFVLINAVSIALLLLSYQFLIRYTFVGWILNGPRHRGVKISPSAPEPQSIGH